jgi:hypothetical protein
MDADDTEVFRAVITVVRVGDRWATGRFERTEIAGPFRKRAGALNAISRAKRENRSWGRESVTVTGRIERSPITWEAVE